MYNHWYKQHVYIFKAVYPRIYLYYQNCLSVCRKHSWISWRLSSPRKAAWRSQWTRSGWVRRRCGRTTIGVRTVAAFYQLGLTRVFSANHETLGLQFYKPGDYHRTKIAGAKKACEAKKETHCRTSEPKDLNVYMCFVQPVCSGLISSQLLVR